jgi:hypothetical protein
MESYEYSYDSAGCCMNGMNNELHTYEYKNT